MKRRCEGREKRGDLAGGTRSVRVHRDDDRRMESVAGCYRRPALSCAGEAHPSFGSHEFRAFTLAKKRTAHALPQRPIAARRVRAACSGSLAPKIARITATPAAPAAMA